MRAILKTNTALFFLTLAANACTQHQVEGTAAMLAAGSAEGNQAYYSRPDARPDLSRSGLELTIDSPAENSKVRMEGLSVSGHCNFDGGTIRVGLLDRELATAFCHRGRWVSGIISIDRLPIGHFQIFVKMHTPDRDSEVAQRGLIK